MNHTVNFETIQSLIDISAYLQSHEVFKIHSISPRIEPLKCLAPPIIDMTAQIRAQTVGECSHKTIENRTLNDPVFSLSLKSVNKYFNL